MSKGLLLQSLTLSPTVRDGVIVYEDSPLVKAVKAGHVLVVDEADKAPTHVTWYDAINYEMRWSERETDSYVFR